MRSKVASRYRQQKPRATPLYRWAAKALALAIAARSGVEKVRIEIHSDASVACAVKQVEIRDVWIRGSVAAKDFVLKKVLWEDSVAGVLTHVLAPSAFVRAGARHSPRLDVSYSPGHGETAGREGGLITVTCIA